MARKCLLCSRWIEDGKIYCNSCKKNVNGVKYEEGNSLEKETLEGNNSDSSQEDEE